MALPIRIQSGLSCTLGISRDRLIQSWTHHRGQTRRSPQRSKLFDLFLPSRHHRLNANGPCAPIVYSCRRGSSRVGYSLVHVRYSCAWFDLCSSLKRPFRRSKERTRFRLGGVCSSCERPTRDQSRSGSRPALAKEARAGRLGLVSAGFTRAIRRSPPGGARRRLPPGPPRQRAEGNPSG